MDESGVLVICCVGPAFIILLVLFEMVTGRGPWAGSSDRWWNE